MGFREKSKSRMTPRSLVWCHIPRQGPRKRHRSGRETGHEPADLFSRYRCARPAGEGNHLQV